jgi:hypothetical protein
MTSIDAVFPAIGGIGIWLIATVDRFAVIGGSLVGAGVVPTGRLACAGPVRTDCVVHGVGLGEAVAVGGEAVAVGGEAVVVALGAVQAKASRAALIETETGLSDPRISISSG